MIKVATFGVLVALAVFVSRFAPGRERPAAVLTAYVVALNWMQFAMPWVYAPASPVWLLSAIGLDASHESVWAVADLFALLIVGRAVSEHHWAPAIVAPYLSALVMLLIAWWQGLKYVEYHHVLDVGLLIQVAALLTIGGGDCADYLSDRWRRLCGVVRRAALHRRAASAMVSRR